MTDAVGELTNFLGQLGARWGLPPDACRVHGLLYLRAKPLIAQDFVTALELSANAVAEALAWLQEYGLVTHDPSGWRTADDPWDLMVRALNERRRRELQPTLDMLRRCAEASTDADPTTRQQIAKLRFLAEDLAAIDAETARLSPQTLKRVLSFGSCAARRVSKLRGSKGGA